MPSAIHTFKIGLRSLGRAAAWLVLAVAVLSHSTPARAEYILKPGDTLQLSFVGIQEQRRQVAELNASFGKVGDGADQLLQVLHGA